MTQVLALRSIILYTTGSSTSSTHHAPISRKLRVNLFIRVTQVRLIDENNENLGVMNTSEARRIALERGYDLVEVSPVANPPVCRLLDYGKLTYQMERQGRALRTKQKRVDIKGVRISLKMGDHDFAVRQERAKKFLAEGHKVKIEMILRGRENAHADRAVQKIKLFIEQLGADVKVEQNIGKQGNRFHAILSQG